jgi:hypothetical protein
MDIRRLLASRVLNLECRALPIRRALTVADTRRSSARQALCGRSAPRDGFQFAGTLSGAVLIAARCAGVLRTSWQSYVPRAPNCRGRAGDVLRGIVFAAASLCCILLPIVFRLRAVHGHGLRKPL